VLTKNNAICGKIINKALNTNIVTQKGRTPLNTVLIDIPLSFTIAETINKFMPTGGVIFDNSIWIITNTPNQMRSMFRELSNGRKIGSVSNIIDSVSIAIPRRK
jgi:hypothetical protein